MAGYMVMIEDKSKPGAAPTAKYAKDEAEAKQMIAVAKSKGLAATMALNKPFANGARRAQQEIANKMQVAGVRVENAVAPTDKEKEAFNKGWAAKRNGKPVTNNPYPVGSKEHDAWKDGYNN